MVIMSGNYGNEQATIANNGTAGSPIVIIAETPGEVVMQGEGGGTGIQIEGNSHITIEGITFRNFGSGVNVYHVGSYITVRKCIFIENNATGFSTWGTSSDISLVHHILAEYNQFYDYTDKQDYGIYFVYSTHCVAKNNYCYGWHHQAISFKRKVHYGLVKDNVFEGFRYSAVYLGQNLDDPLDQRSRYLIAEGNTFSPAKGREEGDDPYRAKTPIWIANVDRAVARNNFMEGRNDVDGGWGQGRRGQCGIRQQMKSGLLRFFEAGYGLVHLWLLNSNRNGRKQWDLNVVWLLSTGQMRSLLPLCNWA